MGKFSWNKWKATFYKKYKKIPHFPSLETSMMSSLEMKMYSSNFSKTTNPYLKSYSDFCFPITITFFIKQKCPYYIILNNYFLIII